MTARLSDLLAGLSRLADFGFGLPMGTAVRSCVLATRLAESLGLPADEVRSAYYTALLHHVGCVGYAHETARLFGDELVVNRAAGRTDAGSPTDSLTTFLPAVVQGRPLLKRARVAVAAITQGARWGDHFTSTACELGRDTARRMGLPETVQTSLFHVYDLWRGGRRAKGVHGDDIPVSARIARLTGVAVLFDSIGGSELAMHEVRRRAGGMLDPGLVAAFSAQPGWLLDTERDAAVLDLEPRPHMTVPDRRIVAEIFADLADLKSPYFVGHSRAVAELAVGAADQLHLAVPIRTELDLAGLLHDVGRVAVPTTVWEKPTRLTPDEWEQVRLHPYISERILAGSSELASLAPLVGRHHERLDGSGFHRGCSQDDLSMPARILAAADLYRTLTEERPHRSMRDPDQARATVLEAVSKRALDHDAAQAVLAAAGHLVTLPPAALPMGLSAREVEVLVLVARGFSNAEVASRLVISRRTAEHHVQHIYAKIGVSSRAAATLFAVEHRLLDRNR